MRITMLRTHLFLCLSLISLCGIANHTIMPNNPIISHNVPASSSTTLLKPENLWQMGRLGGLSKQGISQDKSNILYTVTTTELSSEKHITLIYVTDRKEPLGEGSQPVWIRGGAKITFLHADDKGRKQIWEMNPDGTGRRQISSYRNNIEGFAFSPNEQKVLFISQVKAGPTVQDKHPDLPKATGLIAEDLMYRHWDEWTTTIPHPFWAEFDGQLIGEATDLLENTLYECPMKPFGGIEQLAWTADSKAILYTCRKKTGRDYTLSTNSDIYVYDLSSGLSRNLTIGNGGYDTNPQVSPDGETMAWLSMERDGYESDLNRLFMKNIQTGATFYISGDFQSNVEEFCWSEDGKVIYFSGVWHARKHIYALDMQAGDIKQLTTGDYDYKLIGLGTTGTLIASRHSFSEADDIYSVSINTGKATALTAINKDIFDKLTLGKVEERWVTTTDGKQMLVWVMFPPNFDPNKKYPAILYCQGGPQSAVSQFWSYRWNIQTLAATGYIFVLPNRRGLPGFGTEWNEAISGDYGGQCMRDYLSAIDNVSAEPYVDENRLGCVGASFGGFSVYWLAGHHNKRFKAFVAHDGLFNLEQQYVETEEMWFANWDLGGPFWEKDNEVAQKSYAQSPHLFVEKWDTPILCIHGEKDYRVLASQGMAAFNAARLLNIPAKLLLYPDENHWVLKPQNSILWYRTFIEWLNQHLQN